jgi:hypothetical protein
MEPDLPRFDDMMIRLFSAETPGAQNPQMISGPAK